MSGMPPLSRDEVVLVGVREYAENYPVRLSRDKNTARLVVRAFNQAGFDEVRIDLWDLVDSLKRTPVYSIVEFADGGVSDSVRYGGGGHS